LGELLCIELYVYILHEFTISVCVVDDRVIRYTGADVVSVELVTLRSEEGLAWEILYTIFHYFVTFS